MYLHYIFFVRSSVAILFLMGLCACGGLQDGVNQDNDHIQHIQGLYTKPHAVSQGRMNALHDFVAQRWRLISQNHRPTHQEIVLDFRALHQNQAVVITPCNQIHLSLDTSELHANHISTHTLIQKPHCPVDKELVAILQNLHSFDKKGDRFILWSVNGRLELLPLLP